MGSLIGFGICTFVLGYSIGIKVAQAIFNRWIAEVVQEEKAKRRE